MSCSKSENNRPQRRIGTGRTVGRLVIGLMAFAIAMPAWVSTRAGEAQHETSKAQALAFPSDLSVSGPWHFTNIWITLAVEPVDVESYCVAFTIKTDVTGELPIYISPINQRLNKVPLYGGIQTNVDASRTRPTPMAQRSTASGEPYSAAGKSGTPMRPDRRPVDCSKAAATKATSSA